MRRCRDCGAVFATPMRYIEPHGEVRRGCPRCGGDGETVMPCRQCGVLQPEEQLFDGLCRDCAVQTITPDTALRYAADIGQLAEFLAGWLGSELAWCSEEMLRVLLDAWEAAQCVQETELQPSGAGAIRKGRTTERTSVADRRREAAQCVRTRERTVWARAWVAEDDGALEDYMQWRKRQSTNTARAQEEPNCSPAERVQFEKDEPRSGRASPTGGGRQRSA